MAWVMGLDTGRLSIYDHLLTIQLALREVFHVPLQSLPPDPSYFGGPAR